MPFVTVDGKDLHVGPDSGGFWRAIDNQGRRGYGSTMDKAIDNYKKEVKEDKQ